MIRVILPYHLRNMAKIEGEVLVELDGEPSQRALLDAIEERFPMLRGTIREYETGRRRPYLRFFACREDRSHDDPDAPLPEPVVRGEEPFMVIGSMAGG